MVAPGVHPHLNHQRVHAVVKGQEHGVQWHPFPAQHGHVDALEVPGITNNTLASVREQQQAPCESQPHTTTHTHLLLIGCPDHNLLFVVVNGQKVNVLANEKFVQGTRGTGHVTSQRARDLAINTSGREKAALCRTLTLGYGRLRMRHSHPAPISRGTTTGWETQNGTGQQQCEPNDATACSRGKMLVEQRRTTHISRALCNDKSSPSSPCSCPCPCSLKHVSRSTDSPHTLHARQTTMTG